MICLEYVDLPRVTTNHSLEAIIHYQKQVSHSPTKRHTHLRPFGGVIQQIIKTSYVFNIIWDCKNGNID
jgi:hypothetical protein